MNSNQLAWKQLQAFEKRGDLQKQAELLRQVLGNAISAQALNESLKMALERAQVESDRHPPELYRVDQVKQALQEVNSKTGEVLRECVLPREAGALTQGDLNWSPLGGNQVVLLEAEKDKLKLLQSLDRLESEGLLLNTSYSYLNLPAPRPMHSWFCRSWYHGQMPLEAVKALPYDVFVHPRHPILAVTDRGAGKLHLIQRETFRLARSWSIVSAPNKKALAVCFHPDGKRLFVSGNQKGLLMMVDRSMAQKKLPLPATHLIASVGVSNKGDLLYVLAIHPDTRRPDLWVLDAEKFKQQAVISLEGEAFSTGADARDILEISPDGQYAVVMVSRSQPALFTPCLLLLNLATGKIVDQLNFRPDQKPIHVAFPARELYSPRFRLLPMLLHGGYGLAEDTVKAAFGVDAL